MKIGNKYVFGLFVAAALIVLPGGFARIFGASIDILAPSAVFQLFASVAFFITSLVSLAFVIVALIAKKWKEAAVYTGAILISMATWSAAAFTNGPGWEAVMGI